MIKQIMKKFESKSMIFKLIFSYLILILIVLVSTLASVVISYTALKSEIIRSNEHILNSTEMEFENMFESIEGIINSMTSSTLRQAFLNTSDSFNVKSQKINLIQNELSRLRYVGRNLEQYFIYSRYDDTIIGSPSVLSSSLYYKTYFENSSLPYEEWLGMITTDSNGSFFTFDGGGTKKYVYVSKTPFELLLGKQDISVIFIISGDHIKDINSQRLSKSGSRILLTVPGNDTINFSDDSLLNKLSMDMINENSNGSVKLDGSKYFILNSTHVSKRIYTCAIPYATFFGSLYSLAAVQIIIILLLILVVVRLSFYFSKIHYSPVISILNVIKKYNKNIDDNNENEYKTIKDNIKNLLSGYTSLSEKLETQNINLRRHFLTRYLKGDSTHEAYPLQEAFSNYDLDFRSGKYAVLIFTITDLQGFSLSDEKDAGDDYELCRFVLDNIISELISEKYYCVMHEVDDSLTCIVNFYGDISDDRAQNELTDIFNNASAFIAENFKIHFEMTAGNIKSDPKGVPNAYNEAISVLECNSVFGESNIFPPQISGKTSYMDSFDDYARKITAIIRAGSSNEINEATVNFFNIIMMYSAASPNLVRYEILGFVDSILKEIRTMGAESEAFTEHLAGKYQIEKIKNFNDMKTILLNMFDEICEYTSTNSNSLENSVMGYIRENYHDPNLSVSKIAEFCGLNPYYLSATIKSKSGYGILESINKVRCAHAAELLTSTHQSVQSISAAVGYTNSHTFIRLFKKYYGCTPSQYR